MGVSVQTNQDMEKFLLAKNRNFLFLLISAMFSAPGYYVYLLGCEWLMLTLSDNRVYFGMLFFAAAVPRLIFLTMGGLFADRLNKRTILFISDFSRAVLIGALLIFLWTDTVTSIHLIVLAALFGISDAFSYPALNALTPMLLPKAHLQRGNSIIQMAGQISPILGPALGGSLIALLGFTGVFSVALAMLLLASVTVLFIQLKEKKQDVQKVSAIAELKEGFQYARKNSLIVSIMIMAFFLNFFFSGPLSIGLPVIVKDIFQGTALSLATVEIAVGIGALVGAAVLAAITLKKPGKTMLAGLIAIGIFFLVTGFSTTLWQLASTVAVMAFTIQVVNIPIMTMLQQTTPKHMLGRMMSFLMTVSTGLVPISYAATAFLLAVGIPMQTIIIVSGVVVTTLSLVQLKNKRLLSFRY